MVQLLIMSGYLLYHSDGIIVIMILDVLQYLYFQRQNEFL